MARQMLKVIGMVILKDLLMERLMVIQKLMGFDLVIRLVTQKHLEIGKDLLMGLLMVRQKDLQKHLGFDLEKLMEKRMHLEIGMEIPKG